MFIEKWQLIFLNFGRMEGAGHLTIIAGRGGGAFANIFFQFFQVPEVCPGGDSRGWN